MTENNTTTLDNTMTTINYHNEIVDTTPVKNALIHVNIDENTSILIKSIVNSTGEMNNVVATNGKIHLITSRTYYIPIDNNKINSDNMEHMKVLSEVSDLIDVRYIKNGYACIVPIRHNVILKNNMPIAYLW